MGRSPGMTSTSPGEIFAGGDLVHIAREKGCMRIVPEVASIPASEVEASRCRPGGHQYPLQDGAQSFRPKFEAPVASDRVAAMDLFSIGTSSGQGIRGRVPDLARPIGPRCIASSKRSAPGPGRFTSGRGISRGTRETSPRVAPVSRGICPSKRDRTSPASRTAFAIRKWSVS